MKYTLPSGKTVIISDLEIENSMKCLKISREEAIQMWLEDNDYFQNEEQELLDNKAKNVKIDHNARADKPKGEKKPKVYKNCDEKIKIFSDLTDFLSKNYEMVVLNPNKMIEITYNGKKFKLDLIKEREK